MKFTDGDGVWISGYTDELWIKDYHTKVSSYGVVLETPKKNAKKIFVCIDDIDGEHNVHTFVRKSKLEKINEMDIL